MIVFNDTLGAYGGSHTLMLRMCKWLSEHNIKSAIVCSSNANTEIVHKLEDLGTYIICTDIRDTKTAGEVFKSLADEEDITVFDFAWNYYLDVECIKKAMDLKFSNILYCIHPETFKKGIGFKTKLLRNYSIHQYRKMCKLMNDNKAIIMMDEVDLNESEEYLKISLVPKPEIIRLPMYCFERDNIEDIIQKGYSNNIIMTAARADFPYKGYIIGLIDDFRALKDKYPEVKLEIISDGDDVEQIKEKINSLPNLVVKDLTLHGWMDYSELLQEIEKCKVFVGMGTSVLDAALIYKPAVPVRFGTYEDIGDTLIGRKPGYITPDFACKAPAISIIEEVLAMSFEEYYEECMTSFNQVKQTYDIEIVMRQLIAAKTIERACILSVKERVRHQMNNMFNKIRYRNVSHNDFNKMKDRRGNKLANGK